MTQFLTELLPEQPEPVKDGEEAPNAPVWDFTANIAYMMLKVQAGKCSGKKFREQMDKLVATGEVDA